MSETTPREIIESGLLLAEKQSYRRGLSETIVRLQMLTAIAPASITKADLFSKIEREIKVMKSKIET